MKKRVAGAVLFGAGLFFLVIALALMFVVVPLLARVPFDLQPPVTSVDAHDATFVALKVVHGNATAVEAHADLHSQTAVNPDAVAAAAISGPMKNKAVVWNTYQSTKRLDTGETISESTGKIAQDRVNGNAVDWSGQCYADQIGQKCDAANMSYSGQLYLFPFNTQKKTYQYFDLTLHKPLPMTYQDTETFQGLTVYRFTQVIPEQQLDAAAADIDFLRGSLLPGTTGGSEWYSDTRNLLVEPTTGSIVDYSEQAHRTLKTDSGDTATILDANFRYDTPTRDAVVKLASNGRKELLLFGRYLPIGLAVLAIGALVWGFLLTRRAVTELMPSGAHAIGREEDRTIPLKSGADGLESDDGPEPAPA